MGCSFFFLDRLYIKDFFQKAMSHMVMKYSIFYPKDIFSGKMQSPSTSKSLEYKGQKYVCVCMRTGRKNYLGERIICEIGPSWSELFWLAEGLNSENDGRAKAYLLFVIVNLVNKSMLHVKKGIFLFKDIVSTRF